MATMCGAKIRLTRRCSWVFERALKRKKGRLAVGSRPIRLKLLAGIFIEPAKVDHLGPDVHTDLHVESVYIKAHLRLGEDPLVAVEIRKFDDVTEAGLSGEVPRRR